MSKAKFKQGDYVLIKTDSYSASGLTKGCVGKIISIDTHYHTFGYDVASSESLRTLFFLEDELELSEFHRNVRLLKEAMGVNVKV